MKLLPIPPGSLATDLSSLRVCIHSRCPVVRLHNTSQRLSSGAECLAREVWSGAVQATQEKVSLLAQEVNTMLQMTKSAILSLERR